MQQLEGAGKRLFPGPNWKLTYLNFLELQAKKIQSWTAMQQLEGAGKRLARLQLILKALSPLHCTTVQLRSLGSQQAAASFTSLHRLAQVLQQTRASSCFLMISVVQAQTIT